MLSSLTQSIRQKFHPETVSPAVSHRTISFHQDEEQHQAQKRAFFHYRQSRQQRPPRDADHDDTEEEDDDNPNAIQDEDISSSSHTEEHSPLLPIFSSAHLDALPVFTLTHTFRELVTERCDTVLTWEQLRSPQVSQFVVKPIQFEIKQAHMNAATLYALLANSSQFMKEAGLQPGNSGTNKTRAMVCELIAIRLLRECNARELIDALSYDFDPLQGQASADGLTAASQHKRPAQRVARISCIEVAIRANAKRFLAHPVVVKHLEAIWNGSIVFYAAADSLHRKRQPMFQRSYGTHGPSLVQRYQDINSSRWTATLYNPKEASLFKLSRLRVPRYRNILSTISFAILLTLFLFVNQERSFQITSLEIVFWIWAAGYMLDEVIGFTDQGFSLYIASFWNIFDLGILVLLLIHLVLRLYGLALTDVRQQHIIAGKAYDVLAATAVLLFPRLFSVLDHYRYFSQLIIAFRMMAADMIAIFVLILIFCSGFLVALTFAFSKGDLRDSPKDVAYALLQMLLGFTPAAWDRLGDYNFLGQTILVGFLFVCHFVVVTILITVMTNSFMEVVRNANEEHQFLFAVNVISNVKSDALFAYVPPTNVLQWLLTPLRFVLPFRDYIKVNRSIIKLTHFPILWTIYLYERIILRPRYVDTTDLVASRGRLKPTMTRRLHRQPSIATFRQEAALDEVFRQPTDSVMRSARSRSRRKSSNVVNNWMDNQHDAEPPQEEDRKIVDKLEGRRLSARRLQQRSRLRDFSSSRKPTSVLSDPNDFTSLAELLSPRGHITAAIEPTPTTLDVPSHLTDADGDDEFLANDVDENETDLEHNRLQIDETFNGHRGSLRRDYFTSRLGSHVRPRSHVDTSDSNHPHQGASYRPIGRRDHRPRHARNVSSSTMIYNPAVDAASGSPRQKSTIPEVPSDTIAASADRPITPSSKPSTDPSTRKTPKRPSDKARPRPMMPSQENQAFRSNPDISVFSRSRPGQGQNISPGKPIRRSSLEMELISDIGDNKAIGGGYVGALPASFASQMNYMQQALRKSQFELREAESKRRTEDSEMFGRLMMARMNTLEEGFREVVHEVREGMKQVGSGMVSRQRSPEREINIAKRSKKFRERQERPSSGRGHVVSAGGSAGGSVEGAGERPGSGSGKEREIASENNNVHGGPVKESKLAEEKKSSDTSS